MSAVWGVAVILERFFENTHIVHPQNIGENGRIVIDKGRKEIFFLFLLHYNDTCKVNPSFTGGECKVVKLNILNMKNFLDTVNSCSGKVNMLCPVGKKQNINSSGAVGRNRGKCGNRHAFSLRLWKKYFFWEMM